LRREGADVTLIATLLMMHRSLQAAEMLQVSVSKAYADLEYARAWLRLAMGGSQPRTEP